VLEDGDVADTVSAVVADDGSDADDCTGTDTDDCVGGLEGTNNEEYFGRGAIDSESCCRFKLNLE
jgi:hypothetical protein